MKAASHSYQIRQRLDHPVVDADGHMLEFEPLLDDYLKREGGADFLKKCHERCAGYYLWYRLSPEERRDLRITRPPWGLQTKNALDLATSMIPRLLYERLDDFGIDFAIIYPTLGMLYARAPDPEARGIASRAVNRFYAETLAEHSDRMTAAAIIPTQTPEEAIRELEFAVRELGAKVIVIDSVVRRPVSAFVKKYPDAPPALAAKMTWLDTYGIDSAYDYDPFWAKCVELKVAVTSHLAGHWGTRTSISSYSHNHMGLFASAAEALCKSLFLGGVTRRFPSLNFAFLEGGAGWACSLYSDLIEHWEKRNLEAVQDYDPKRLDHEALRALIARHGGEDMARRIEGRIDDAMPNLFRLSGWVDMDPALLDEWAACKIESKEDIHDLFVRSFYFGCEADDPSVAWSFNRKTNPMGAKLNAFFGSDIGHWDVPDMTQVLAEAYEGVEKEWITPDEFRDYTFTNPVKLHAGMNPDFFKGTVIEAEVDRLLK